MSDYDNFEAEATVEIHVPVSNGKKFRSFLGGLGTLVVTVIVMQMFIVLGWMLRVGYVVNDINVPVVETAMSLIISSTPTETPSDTPSPIPPTFTPTITPSPSETQTPTATVTPSDTPSPEMEKGDFWVDVLVLQESDELCLNTVSTVFSADLISEMTTLGLFDTDGVEYKINFIAEGEIRFFEEGVVIFEELEAISLDEDRNGMEDLSVQLWLDAEVNEVTIDIEGLDESLYEIDFVYSVESIEGSEADGCTAVTEAAIVVSQAAPFSTQTWTPSPTPTATIWVATQTVRCEPQVSIEQLDAIMWAIFIHLDTEPAGCIMPPAGYIENGYNRTRGNEATYEIASLLSSTGQQLYMAAIEDGFTGKISIVGQPPFVANGFHFTYQPESNPITSVVIRFLGSSELWEFTVTPTFVPLASTSVQASASPTPSWTPSITPTAIPSFTLGVTETVAVQIVSTSSPLQTATERIQSTATLSEMPTQQAAVQVIIGTVGSADTVNRSITLILSAERAAEIRDFTESNTVSCSIILLNRGNRVYSSLLFNPVITINPQVGQPENSGMSINYVTPIDEATVSCYNREWVDTVRVEIQN